VINHKFNSDFKSHIIIGGTQEWHKEDVDFWDGLAMEVDSLRDKMIARQKSKGKRELLNCKAPSIMASLKLLLSIRKARLTWCRIASLGGLCGLFCGPLVFSMCFCLGSSRSCFWVFLSGSRVKVLWVIWIVVG
jgi:hypothetical protein